MGANRPHPDPDQPATHDPPSQPMPPAPDLHFVVPPTDPIGVPQQPVSTEPVRGDGMRSSRTARIVATGIALLIVAAVVALFWLFLIF